MKEVRMIAALAHVLYCFLQNIPLLSQFLSSTGKIFPKSRSMLCGKHQRKLAKAIKRSRQMALIPYGGNLDMRRVSNEAELRAHEETKKMLPAGDVKSDHFDDFEFS